MGGQIFDVNEEDVGEREKMLSRARRGQRVQNLVIDGINGENLLKIKRSRELKKDSLVCQVEQ